ncbi:MAG: hypothetical protein JNM07_04225 [Phycisphaerae bacterium]|nr:hypothetical protein [Phycisphaerae bacterium]
MVLWARLDERNVLWVEDELVRRQTVLDDLVRQAEARPWPRPEWFGADPAGHAAHEQTGRSSIGALARLGWRIRARRAGLREGIHLVKARLRPGAGASRIRVASRCDLLLESLERYRYPDHDPETEVPLKDGHDHACDALRYMVLNLDAPGADGPRCTRYV